MSPAGRARPPVRERIAQGFTHVVIELGLRTVMTGVLVACLVGLRKRDNEAVAERA